MPFDVYDFTDLDRQSVIAKWSQELTPRSRGQLDSKLHMLATNGMDLPSKLLAGPIKKTGHIYKLIIHADVMLRPMLCRGPFEMEAEFTLLVGAKEIQGRLIPDPEVAVHYRNLLLKDAGRRIPHEW